MPVNIDYDKECDVLFMFKDKEKSKHSIQAFDVFVIDVSHTGKVVGLEILNSSKVLKVSKEDLAEIKEANFSTFSKGVHFGVNYRIKFAKSSIDSQVMLPQAMAAHHR